MKAWDFQDAVPVFAVAALYVGGLIFEWKREKALKDLALRHSFTFIGNALPRSLTLIGTALDKANSVSNVIDGDCNRFRIVAFDCRIGSGKGSYRRTMIATQGISDHSAILRFNPDLAVDRSGAWTILYEPKNYAIRRMTVTLLEKHVERLNC